MFEPEDHFYEYNVHFKTMFTKSPTPSSDYFHIYVLFRPRVRNPIVSLSSLLHIGHVYYHHDFTKVLIVSESKFMLNLHCLKHVWLHILDILVLMIHKVFYDLDWFNYTWKSLFKVENCRFFALKTIIIIVYMLISENCCDSQDMSWYIKNRNWK